MSFLHGSILFIHLKTLGKIIYLNCFRHFSVRRLLFTLLFLVVYLFVAILLTVGRLLDEVLFFRYRAVEIKEPVFIISNPRSGTTYLHRLIGLDEERFIYTLLYHAVFTSVTLFKLIDFFSKIDRRIGRPMRKFFDFIDDKLFDGWKNIHPMGINQSEEDEGMFVIPLITTAVCMICPFMEEMKYLTVPDELPEKQRRRLRQYYESSMKRFAYATGKDKTILSKNVNSIGRIKTVLSIFPDAKVIYLIRQPKKAVPSFISMFAAPWKAHSPEIPENSKHHQVLGQVAMDFYSYFHKIKPDLIQENLVTIRYEDLVAKPIETVLEVYKQFDLSVSEIFLERLKKETSKQRTYRSKHSYSLEQYGMSEAQVEEELADVLEEYGFMTA